MTDHDPVAAAVAALVAAIRAQVLAEIAAAPSKPADQMPGRELLTLVEARERLRISKATLDRLLKQGRIQKVKIGARAFVALSEVERFIAESTAD